MNKFNWRRVVVLACFGVLLSPQLSFGLGLGLPVTRAVLGDALQVSVPVRLEIGEELLPECVKAEVLFGEDKLPASLVQARLVRPQTGVFQNGDVAVQIQTVALVNEPVVTVSMTVGCASRITRRFVTLVDPPAMAPPRVMSSSEPQGHTINASEVRAALRSDVVPSVIDPSSAHRSTLGQGLPSFKVSKSVTREGASSAAKNVPKKSSVDASTLESKRPAVAPRLVLDPVALETQVAPDLRMSSGLAAAPSDDPSSDVEQKRRAATAVWLAMNASPEETARDQQRLADVEARLARLSQDSENASQALSRVQDQISGRGSERDGLLYVMAFAVVGLIAYIAWRERGMRQMQALHQTWLASQLAQDLVDDHQDSLVDRTDPSTDELSSKTDQQREELIQSVTDPDDGSPSVDLLLPTGPGSLAELADAKGAQPQNRFRDVSVDELIDLDQQVEFFMVLGQEESAIDVLESYIRVSGASTPMPFLKLLELYRQAGLRADYERTRMNFNLQFNAHAPLWDADPEHGHVLEDYPGIIDRIQALWLEPKKAMGVIERSLMRQDVESYTFDLPAYRELFLLYLVLKDLLAHPVAETQAGQGLEPQIAPPFDVELEESAKPLMATLPMKTLPELAPVLSLDLELGEHGLVLATDEGESSDGHKP